MKGEAYRNRGVARKKIFILWVWQNSVVGKHPDLLVGPPTSTVFPTNDKKFKKSQFFEKIFEKI
jgi:hypothetical protein